MHEAISNHKQGKEIKPEKNKPISVPVELEEQFTSSPELKGHFDSLSLSKQRDFAEYIGEAKRQDTKQKRLEKIIPMILKGVGLNDKYK